MFGYEDLLNFDIKKTEAAISVQEITSNWNKFVSKFLKEFIFLKYISYGKFYAILSTFTVSGFFHNYKPSTLLFFLSFPLLGKILDDFNKNFENNLIKRIQTSLFVSYFSVPFLTQSVKETFIVWKSVYFYMHIYIGICGILLLLKFIYLKLTKIKDSEKKID
ncbi:ALE1 [Hepatospora eriocheir]|uniref:ALE1 n=1 Tax=Hepatospora eriocheir TaxID=1081669 RepID=A0A1X0QD61_9MICR|nr:ALE1 [Hepatospora eriocheir]